MFGIVNGILGMFGSEVILGIGGKLSFGIVGPMGKLGSGGIVSPFGKVGKLGCGRDGMEGILGFGKFGPVDWRRLRAASPLSMLIKAKAMNKTKVKRLLKAIIQIKTQDFSSTMVVNCV
ncbi:hypothetical protein F8388_004932 [Cannabis sativa]|uniref:Uncharacterized protein n=1 Tax=Cannabis sativa TaxID=3483 RepID=A0A7J6HNX5_CANSA|nr:hypothetical protein F8388_004932 [Cannabis sativa]